MGVDLPTDAQAAQTYCSEAGDIAVASGAEVQSLRDATRGVVEDLRADPATAAIIDAITALATDDPAPERVAACSGDGGAEAALNGSYAFSVSPEDCRAAGMKDEGKIEENAGDWRVILHDGTWEAYQQYVIGPKAGTEWTGTGDYSFEGGRLTIYWSHEPGDGRRST